MKRITPITTEYWVEKGYTNEEAVQKVSEIQRGRSRKGCWKWKGVFAEGQKINDWIVLCGEPDHINASGNKSHDSFISVRCKCGVETKVAARYLKNGRSKCCRKCGSKRRDENHKWSGYKDLTGTLLSHIKQGAKRRGIEFSVSKQYLYDLYYKQNGRCALTGKEMSWDEASLDRIDSNKGYIEGNVQWVLKQVNLMKHKLTTDEFIKICKDVVRHHE